MIEVVIGGEKKVDVRVDVLGYVFVRVIAIRLWFVGGEGQEKEAEIAVGLRYR